LACLLYCATLLSEEFIENLVGGGEQPVCLYETSRLCVYWSEVATPEALIEGASRRLAEQRYRQVLRDIISRTTTLSFPFPSVVADLADIEKLLGEQQTLYVAALTHLANKVQYELTATWTADDQTDLATPIKGSEYLKRRDQTQARVATIEAKLKSVTSGIVLDWRSGQYRRNHIWYALLLRDAREHFIASLRTAGPSEGVRLRLSGPWPPDQFAGLRS
jgi:hypothetical protein